MEQQVRPLWWIAVVSVLIAMVAIAWIFFGRPVPGDIIIVQPDPVDSNNVNSAYWTIGGSDPVAQYEPPNVDYLNKNAFRKIKQYYARARKDAYTPPVKINMPSELKASFGHCSDLAAGVLHACATDADCPMSGPTCVVSTVRLTTESGTPNKFHWYLKVDPNSAEMELTPRDYKNPTKWRAELCGRLIGDITVTFNNTVYVVPSGNHAAMWADP